MATEIEWFITLCVIAILFAGLMVYLIFRYAAKHVVSVKNETMLA